MHLMMMMMYKLSVYKRLIHKIYEHKWIKIKRKIVDLKLFVFIFFFGDDKPNLSYTKGKEAGLRRSRNKPEGIEPSPDQTGAQHTRLIFFGDRPLKCDIFGRRQGLPAQ